MTVKKLSSFGLLCLLVFGLLGGAFLPNPVQAQSGAQGVANVCILAASTDKGFPQVQVQFRALDVTNHALTSLTRSGVKITENNKEIPPTPELVKNTSGVGLNLFFVVDQGNRTSQDIIKMIMLRYGDAFMADGLDSAAIITDVTLAAPSFHTYQEKTSSKARFVNAVNQFPTKELANPLSGISTVREAISQIRAMNASCAKPSAIILLSGEDVELYRDPNVVPTIIADANSLGVPIHVVHVPGPLGTFAGEELFKQIAGGTKGIYTQARSAGTSAYTGIDQELFQKLVADRVTYTAEYRSTDGTSGDHTIAVQGVGQANVGPAGTTRFTVKLAAPTVTITSPNEGFVINRSAKNPEEPYEWDVDTNRIEFMVEFPDKLPRNLKSADLKVGTTSGTQTVMNITPGSGSKFQMDWDLKEIKSNGANPFVLQVWVTDELGLEARSNPVNVQVLVSIPGLPTPVPNNPLTPAGTVVPWALIVGGGGLAILIVAAVAVGAIRRASARVQEPIIMEEGVTVTPGNDSGMGPLATILVLAGPADLRNQKIPINMPMVTLGRGSRADIQFKLGDHSSVSRIHATLTKDERGWSISPIVASRGETLLNGQRLSPGEVYPLENGDHIQLGTVGYNHVEFEFIAESIGLDTDTSDTQVPGEQDRPLDRGGERSAGRNVPSGRSTHREENGETRVDIVDAPSSISKQDRDKILRQGEKPRRSNDDWLSKL